MGVQARISEYWFPKIDNPRAQFRAVGRLRIETYLTGSPLDIRYGGYVVRHDQSNLHNIRQQVRLVLEHKLSSDMVCLLRPKSAVSR